MNYGKSKFYILKRGEKILYNNKNNPYMVNYEIGKVCRMDFDVETNTTKILIKSDDLMFYIDSKNYDILKPKTYERITL